jgi:hypothetical protein
MNDDDFADWRTQVESLRAVLRRLSTIVGTAFSIDAGLDARTVNRFLSAEAYAPQPGTVSALREWLKTKGCVACVKQFTESTTLRLRGEPLALELIDFLVNTLGMDVQSNQAAYAPLHEWARVKSVPAVTAALSRGKPAPPVFNFGGATVLKASAPLPASGKPFKFGGDPDPDDAALLDELRVDAQRAEELAAAADSAVARACKQLDVIKAEHCKLVELAGAAEAEFARRDAAAVAAATGELEARRVVVSTGGRVQELERLLGEAKQTLKNAEDEYSVRAAARKDADDAQKAAAALLAASSLSADEARARVNEITTRLQEAEVVATDRRRSADAATAKRKEAEEERVVARSFVGGMEDGFFEVAVSGRRKLTQMQRARVRQRTDGFCYLCKSALPEKGWHVEHVLAFSASPATNDVLGNMLPSCRTCNLRKGTKSLADCMTRDGFSLMTAVVTDDDLSMQPHVKRVLMHALSMKRELRGKPIIGDIVVLCDELVAVLERTALAVIDETELDMEKLPIGKGGQGSVCRAKWSSRNLVVAVKTFTTSPVLDKVECYATLEHANILRVFGRGVRQVDTIGRCTFVVLELMDGSLETGEGVDFLWRDGKRHLLGIIGAIKYLHNDRKMMHRDIKPANFLYRVVDSVVKLADFDWARDSSEAVELTKGVGTRLFMAPEVRNGSAYSLPCDVYSFGMTLKEWLSGRQSSTRDEIGVSLTDVGLACTAESLERRPTATELFHWISTGRIAKKI